MLFGGDKAEYEVEFEDAIEVAGIPAFEVGDEVRGRVKVTPKSDLKLNSLKIQLKWTASGKGNTNTGVSDERVDSQVTELRGGMPYEADFSLQLGAEGPLSYDGKVTNIAWSLNIYLDIPWGVDDEHGFPMLVVSRPLEA